MSYYLHNEKRKCFLFTFSLLIRIVWNCDWVVGVIGDPTFYASVVKLNQNLGLSSGCHNYNYVSYVLFVLVYTYFITCVSLDL